MKQGGTRNGVSNNIQGMKGHGNLETENNETGRQGQESKTRGNRDEQGGVGDRVEIGWRWVREGEWRCDGEGVEQNGVIGDPSVIWYLLKELRVC